MDRFFIISKQINTFITDFYYNNKITMKCFRQIKDLKVRIAFKK